MLVTGINNNTATLIEKKLNEKLIWLPCRDHIFETIFKGMFELYQNKTSGLSVSIFKPSKVYRVKSIDRSTKWY